MLTNFSSSVKIPSLHNNVYNSCLSLVLLFLRRNMGARVRARTHTCTHAHARTHTHAPLSLSLSLSQTVRFYESTIKLVGRLLAWKEGNMSTEWKCVWMDGWVLKILLCAGSALWSGQHYSHEDPTTRGLRVPTSDYPSTYTRLTEYPAPYYPSTLHQIIPVPCTILSEYSH